MANDQPVAVIINRLILHRVDQELGLSLERLKQDQVGENVGKRPNVGHRDVQVRTWR